MKSEKSDRAKYIRALERFVSNAAIALKKDKFDRDLFKKNIEKKYQNLIKIKPVFLDSTYAKSLENFAKLLILEKDREELIKEFNLLCKLKNSKNYKKQKHKTTTFCEF